MKYEVKIKKQIQNGLIDIFDTYWFKKVNQSTTPGESIRIYRQNQGLT